MGANKTFFFPPVGSLTSFPPAKKVKNLRTTHSMVEEGTEGGLRRGEAKLQAFSAHYRDFYELKTRKELLESEH